MTNMIRFKVLFIQFWFHRDIRINEFLRYSAVCMTPSHVKDTVEPDVAMCIPLLSQTPIVCRTPRSKSPRCHAHSGVKKTNFFKNSALSCSRRSQAPRCHAHCGVWLQRVMHTSESKCTPQSQNRKLCRSLYAQGWKYFMYKKRDFTLP